VLKTHHRFFRTIFQLVDASVVALSWYLAYLVRFHVPTSLFPPAQDFVPFSDYALLTLILMVLWFISLQISGAYKSWRMENIGTEIFSILKASLLAFLMVVAGTYFFAREEYSRIALALFLAIVVLLLSVTRVGLRFILRAMRRRGYNQRFVLLVGDATLCQSVYKRVLGRSELGLQVRGCVLLGSKANFGVQELGRLEDLENIIQSHGINHVIVSVRNEDAAKIDGIISTIIDLNVEIRVVPDISQYSILGFEVEEFDGLPILTLNQSPMVGWNAVLKRMSDIVYSIFALIVFSPFMLIIALIVKLSSKGPIFYMQERMGMDGRTFKMYKFRSMRTDAEAQTGAVWATKGDDRTTWIGRVLRKTSLDELPQFINVLKGEMSCVGPRPERPVFVEKFRKEIPGYMLRHKVKAGITGWAQINGLRGNTSLEERIEYDLFYITHWSLAFDLRIMLMTLFKGFISPHAY
jgi:Undecaprenyl-phosphate glucose phosphotransferase